MKTVHYIKSGNIRFMDYIKQINNDLGGGYIIMKDFSNHLEYNQQAILVALQIITNIIHDNVPIIKVVIDMFDETRNLMLSFLT